MHITLFSLSSFDRSEGTSAKREKKRTFCQWVALFSLFSLPFFRLLHRAAHFMNSPQHSAAQKKKRKKSCTDSWQLLRRKKKVKEPLCRFFFLACTTHLFLFFFFLLLLVFSRACTCTPSASYARFSACYGKKTRASQGYVDTSSSPQCTGKRERRTSAASDRRPERWWRTW